MKGVTVSDKQKNISKTIQTVVYKIQTSMNTVNRIFKTEMDLWT